MRDRGSAVIVENGHLVMIKRKWDGETYFVFPGGGIETGETPIDTAIREAKEELGVNIRANELLGTVQFNGIQYYYLSEIVSGTIGTGTGEEYTNGRGTYEPVLLALEELHLLDIRPKEVVEMILKYRGIG